jgi:hypothetical protein
MSKLGQVSIPVRANFSRKKSVKKTNQEEKNGSEQHKKLE